MRYWEIVTRSFRIAWDHKYLWLIAFFSGEGGGGFNYSQSQRTTGTTTGSQPNFEAAVQQATSWIAANLGLLIGLAILWLVIVIAFFILAAVCEGATVRASAEHDAGRPFGLRLAWRMGVHTMWVIVRLRLLVLLLELPLILLVGAWIFALVKAIVDHNHDAIGPLILTALILIVVWILYASYLFFLDRYGNRVIVLEEVRSATAAIARAHRLLTKRLGRSVLLLLISIGVGLVIGIALACILAVVFLPFLAIAGVMAAGSSAPPWPAIVLGLAILVPLSLLIGGFFSAQGSTYWTLAFRRLDIDDAPAYPYPTAPQAPPAPQT